MPEPVRPSRVRGALPAVAGISLANKSQLLFGLAAAVILSLALAVPWVRGGLLIRAFEAEEARRIAAAWIDGRVSIAEDDVRTGAFEPRVNATDRVVDVAVVPLVAAAVTDDDGDPPSPALSPTPPSSPTPPDARPDGSPDPADPRPGAEDAARFVPEAAAAFRADPTRPPMARRYRVADRSVIRVATPLSLRTLEAIPDRPARLRFRLVSTPEDGCAADLILVRESPMDDPATLADPLLTVAAGRIVHRASEI